MWNNIKRNREEFKEERINGRLYVKYGINCATTVSYFIYKVYDPSVESFKYAYMLGVARQNPGDTVIDKDLKVGNITVKNLTLEKDGEIVHSNY